MANRPLNRKVERFITANALYEAEIGKARADKRYQRKTYTTDFKY